MEFTLSPPEPNRCTSHDTDCYGSIHVSLLQTDRYTGTDCFPWLYKAEHTQTLERHSTVDKLPQVGGDEEERRVARWSIRTPAQGAWHGFAYSLAAKREALL